MGCHTVFPNFRDKAIDKFDPVNDVVAYIAKLKPYQYCDDSSAYYQYLKDTVVDPFIDAFTHMGASSTGLSLQYCSHSDIEAYLRSGEGTAEEPVLGYIDYGKLPGFVEFRNDTEGTVVRMFSSQARDSVIIIGLYYNKPEQVGGKFTSRTFLVRESLIIQNDNRINATIIKNLYDFLNYGLVDPIETSAAGGFH